MKKSNPTQVKSHSHFYNRLCANREVSNDARAKLLNTRIKTGLHLHAKRLSYGYENIRDLPVSAYAVTIKVKPQSCEKTHLTSRGLSPRQYV